MKRIVKIVIIMAAFLIIFQFLMSILKKNHVVDYSLTVDDRIFEVHEEYHKTAKYNYYYFKINTGDRIFTFNTDNKFNKQKQIIKSLIIYSQDDLLCISPKYINDSIETEIYCNDNGVQESYYSISQRYNLEKLINYLPSFDKELYKDTTNIIGTYNYEQNNLKDGETLIVYKYNYLDIIREFSSYNINFADYDVYNNKLGILIDKYYIMPKYENKALYNKFLIMDIANKKVSEIEFEKSLSTQLYINGVVNGKLYFFDKSNMKQYEINPKKNTYRITGDVSSNAQFHDGEKWITENIYDFVNREVKFTKNYPISGNYTDIFETERYYYYTSNGKFYRVSKNDISLPTLLFERRGAKEIRVANENIYFIDGSSLYRYDDHGLKKILVNKEFDYNYNNIYDVYFE